MKPTHIAYVLNHLWNLTPISMRSVSQCIRKKHNHEIYPNNNLQLLTIKLSKKNCIIYKNLLFQKLYKSRSNNPKKMQEREREKESQWFYHHCGCRRGCWGYLGSQEPMGSWDLGSHVQLKLGVLDVTTEVAWSLQRCRRHHLGWRVWVREILEFLVSPCF